MKAIWKFPLEFAPVQTVEMPQGASLLCVQMQGGIPCLWALVYPEATREARRLRMVGTGHAYHDSDLFCEYVGTFQMQDGGLVFHVFSEAMF